VQSHRVVRQVKTAAVRSRQRSGGRRDKVRTERRILVATAGEAESRGALRLTAVLAARDASAVLALGVAAPFPGNMSSLVSVRHPVAPDERSRLDVLENVRQAVQGVPGAELWEKRALNGMPLDLINAAASEWKASMIVLGIGRHTRMDRIFGTETAVAVMRGARCPVLAVPQRISALPTRAVAALDFTQASLAAATLAADLLAEDGTLLVAHVCAFRGVKSDDGDLVDVYRAGARAKLDDAVRLLKRRTERRVEGVMLEGEPAAALVSYARREKCDLIALGGHPLGLMDRILLGSVRTRVIRDAPCSVLIAPPDQQS
jgi:nucleotide-binding universal stress UspA family protein